MLDQVILVIKSRLWTISAIVGTGIGVCVCGGGLEEFWQSDEESAIGDGGGRREWLVTRPRVGERWPGIVSLKTASLEK